MRRVAALLFMVVAMPSLAQAPDVPTASPDEIVVTGVKQPWSLEGKRIRAAQRAFVENRTRYAPMARMMLQLLIKDGRSLEGVSLVLHDGDEDRLVSIGSDGRFELPAVRSDNARLVANRPAVAIGVRLWVVSPDADEPERRVGDLRLHCRVGWALMKDRYSLIQRAAFAAADGCNSTRIHFYTSATRPITAALLLPPGQPPRSLEVVGGQRYRLPIAVTALPDDARVRLTYR